MITTTLKTLLDHDFYVQSYNKLACCLTGNVCDFDSHSYVPYEHDQPISLQTILESNGLYDALWALRACEQTPELIQAARLYVVCCARQVQHHMTDERSISALDVAERHAYGLATDVELNSAYKSAFDAVNEICNSKGWASKSTFAARGAAWSVTWGCVNDSAVSLNWASEWTDVRNVQKQMFIDVFCGESINIDPLKKK